MNDLAIRRNLRIKQLSNHFENNESIVIEELGLNHGKNRADIAILHRSFIGYEIKSNNDTLRRLKKQIKSYDAVFDKVYIVAGSNHINLAQRHLPSWWGIIEVVTDTDNNMCFKTIRKALTNTKVDPVVVAKLLWRDEVVSALKQRQISSSILRKPREILYNHLADMLNISEIKKLVIDSFRKRKNWRSPEPLFQHGG